ncbi:MAG: transporter substrate-binding domain-containing protein, partial [Bdellovibrionales bacterium]|nr:transporter substrate-binding domain-containing protein [Bdellovibrionales bacterium]
MKYILFSLLFSTGLFAKDFKFNGQDYPPFNFMENGKATGATTEIVAAMCAITKDNCTVELVPLKRAMSSLESGEVHGVISLLKNAERDAFANFSPTIIKSDMIYATVNDKATPGSVAELKGWTLGAVASSSSAKTAAADAKVAGEGAKVVEESDNDTVVKKLANGRYGEKGAVIINEDVLTFLSKKHAATNIKKMFVAKSDDFGIYFSKKTVVKADLDKFSLA